MNICYEKFRVLCPPPPLLAIIYIIMHIKTHAHKYMHTHTHTHTYIYIYIYILSVFYQIKFPPLMDMVALGWQQYRFNKS